MTKAGLCSFSPGFPKASSLWSHCVLIAPPQNDRHVFPRKLNQGHSKLKTLSHAPLGNANVLPTSDAVSLVRQIMDYCLRYFSKGNAQVNPARQGVPGRGVRAFKSSTAEAGVVSSRLACSTKQVQGPAGLIPGHSSAHADF